MPPKMDETHLAGRSRKRKELDAGDDVGVGEDACCGLEKTGALNGDSELSPDKKKRMQESSDSINNSVVKSRKRKKASIDHDDGDCVIQQEEKRLRRYATAS